MKYLIACLFAIGMFSAVNAQTDPARSSDETFICYYVDNQTLQCDLSESEGATPDEGVLEEDMSTKPSEREDVFGKENKSREDRSREEDFGNPEEGSFGTDTSGIYPQTKEGEFDQPEDMNKSESDEGVIDENKDFQNDPSADDSEELNQDSTHRDSNGDTENGMKEDPSVNEGVDDGMVY